MEGHAETDLSIEANNDTSSLKSDVREGEETISSSKTTNTPGNIYNRDGIISTKDSMVDKTMEETNDKMEIEEVNQQVQGKEGGTVVESVISEEKLLLGDTVENVVSDVLTGLIETITNEDTSKAQNLMKKETETKLNKLLAESVADNTATEETMSKEGEDGNLVVDKLKNDATYASGGNDLGKMNVDDSQEKMNLNREIDTKPGTNDILLQDSNQIGRAEAVQHENYSEDDDSVGAFALLGKRIGKKKKKKKRKSKQSKRASIHIYEINKKDPLPSCTTKEESTDHSVEVVTDHTNSIAESDCVDDTVGEEEDPLLFYSSAHEEQDFHSTRLKRRLEAEMTMLQEEKNEDMQKIQAYVDAKGEERNAALQSEINRIRVSMIAKQTRQRTQLTEKHKKQIEADQNKIKDGERWLIEKQKQEMQARSEQHKGHQWSEIAFQLTERHKFQLKQFEEKKIEMSKRSAQEVNAQNQILEAHHRKRQIEGEKYIEDRVNETRRQQENLKARLLRLHRERFEQRQKEITLSCDVKTLGEGPDRQLNKDKTTKHTPHDAVVRQKKRKAVMNNKSIQLAVEIHNEGIIVISRSNQDECDEKSQGNESGPSSVFIPWGSKSKSILYSLIVGEIPCGDELGEAGRGLLSGGLVKCVITDTRVSEDTAAHERADAFEQVVQAESTTNVDDIERRYKNTCALMSSLKSECSSLMEKEEQLVLDHKMAALELDRSVAIMNKFKAQAQNFFNQDGTPNPRVNPDSQHKLISAMHRYKENLERATNKEATLRQPLELLAKKKAELQQAEQDVKSLGMASKRRRQSFTVRRTDEEHSLETKIDRLNEALHFVAERRRAQVIKNKGNSRSDEPGDEKKKSFHQKMLRRRITTLLRPNVQTLVNDVKQRVSKNPRHRRKDCFDIVYDNDESISPDLRAEQLLYLAIHPQSDEVPLPQAPNENIPNERWCEPGWKLMLDADNDNNNSSNSILSIGTEGKLAQDNLSSCCSSRHAASLINRRHLRMLSECPFSQVCQASAPAESLPMGREDKMVDDPMSATDEEMRLGYNFIVRHPVVDGVMKEGKKKRRSSKKIDTDQKDKPTAKKRIKEASPPAQLSSNNNDVQTNQQQIITDPQQADQYRLMMQMRLQAFQQQQIMQGLPLSQIQQIQGMPIPPHLISQQMQQGNHSSSGLPSPLQGGGSRQSSMTGSVNGGLPLSSHQNSIGMNPQLGPASNQHLPLPLPPPPPPQKK